MGVFAVYSLSDSVDAHNILSMQSQNDVFSQMYSACTARLHVESAHFKEEYRGPVKLHKPYMELDGTVGSIYLEDDDARLFPCGAKELELMQPQHIRVHYVLSSEELSDVVRMGLFSDKGDFDVPTNVVGNIMDIPVTIRYTGIYESPFAAVEIMDPGLVYTCTRETNYYGLFNACRVSEEIAAEKLEDFEYYPHKDYSMYEQDSVIVQGPESVNEQHVEDVPSPVPQQDQEQPAFADEDEMKSVSAVQKLIAEHAAEAANRRAAVDTRTAGKAIVDRVNERLRERAGNEDRSGIVSDMLFGDEQQADTKPFKPTYEDFKTAAMDIVAEAEYAMVHEDELSETEESEMEADDVREQSAMTDRAVDNQMMNQGVTDIAGFNAASDALLQGLTPEQIKEIEDKKSGKAQQRTLRQQDIAADNLAMNQGIMDIAGQGAGNSVENLPVHADSGNALEGKLLSAADLVSGLSEADDAAPGQDSYGSNDEQEFL